MGDNPRKRDGTVLLVVGSLLGVFAGAMTGAYGFWPWTGACAAWVGGTFVLGGLARLGIDP